MHYWDLGLFCSLLTNESPALRHTPQASSTCRESCDLVLLRQNLLRLAGCRQATQGVLGFPSHSSSYTGSNEKYEAEGEKLEKKPILLKHEGAHKYEEGRGAETRRVVGIRDE
ncbi:hypothetical protein NMY22_g16563 [Coprinellus aureogranulatus]|nr:hypothetical protein NMY22_g16563 [Coprinellus aureogranulatus]